MSEEPKHPGIEPELEARIVALVLGEASDFEREELNRLIGLRPELAAFKLQMQRVHGLLQEVGAGEFEAPAGDWKLPAERRNAVLAAIRGEAMANEIGASLAGVDVGLVALRAESSTQPLPGLSGPGTKNQNTAGPEGRNNVCVDPSGLAQGIPDHRWRTPPAEVVSAHSGLNPGTSSLARRVRKLLTESLGPFASSVSRRVRKTPTKIAAGVCAVGLVGMMALPWYFDDEKAASDQLTAKLWNVERYNRVPLSDGTDLIFEMNGESRREKSGFRSGKPIEDAVSERFHLYGEAEQLRKSEVALSAIQNTLRAPAALPGPAYLNDDIQYMPADSEFMVAEEAIAQTDVSVWGIQDRATATIQNAPTSAPQAVDSPEFIASKSGDSKLNIVFDSIASMDAQQDEVEPLIAGVVILSDSNGSGVLSLPGAEDSEAGPSGTPAFGSRRWSLRGRDSSAAAAVPSPDSDAGIVGSFVWDGSSSSLLQPPVNAPDAGVVAPGGVRRQVMPESARSGESETPLPAMNHELSELSSSGAARDITTENLTLGFADVAAPDDASRIDVEFDFNNQDVQSQVSGPGPALLLLGDGRETVREFSKDHIAAPTYEIRVDGEQLGNERTLMEVVDLADTSERAREQTGMSVYGRGGRALGRSAGESPTAASALETGDDGVNKLWNESSKEIAADAEGIADKKKDFTHVDDSALQKLVRSKAPAAGEQDKTLSAVELPVVDGFNLSLSSAIKSPAGEPARLSKLEQLGNAPGADSDEEGFKKQSEAKPGSASVAINSGRDGVAINSGKTPDRFLHGMPLPRLANGTWSDKPAENGKPLLSYHSGNHFFVPSEILDELNDLQRKSGEVAGTPHVLYRRYGFVAPKLDEDSKSMKQLAAKRIAAPAGLNEQSATDEAFSTFSLHVSDVSFKLAFAALGRGEWPEAAKVRIEEFVNAFDYGDPMPGKEERVACCLEQSIHPFVQQRNLLRVSMRTAAAGRSSNTPLRLTFLLDNSGSMERIDRQQTVRRAFALLAQQLTPIDQVTLISFARQPRLLADKVSGADAGKLVGLIDELPSEGGTNIEAALQLAFEKAREQQTPDAQNRIILLTDGAVNLGNADPESLSQMVTTMRSTGIAFDAAGISAEGLNDEVLEALTRKGDGRYYLLDSIESADEGFARQIAGALRPSAKNVKVQVEFNPKRVGHYKLLGFEKHILKKEDFRNDKVDAAEMAAAEAGVAMYQFEAKPDGEGDVGSVSVRFLDLSTGQMVENRWPIPYEADAPRIDQSAPSLRIAVSAALLAAKLRGEPLGESVDLQALSHLMSGLPQQDRNDNRVQQLQQMIEQARQLSGK